MKKTFVAILISFIALGVHVGGSTNSSAIIYSLPKTTLKAKIKVVKTTYKAGPYYRYAERYLGISDVVTNNFNSYEIKKVSIGRYTEADSTKTFTAKGNDFISLNKKGIIKGVNLIDIPKHKQEKKKKEKIDKQFIGNTILTEDQLMANSVAKMAENAARQIYRIRESRLSLISGENEKLPSDGESLKIMLEKLDQSEAALMELFTGTKEKQTIKECFEIPQDSTLQKEIFFRLSTLNGIVDKDDLSGSPIYISVSYIKNSTPSVRPGNREGFFYNLPGIARISVFDDEETYCDKKIEVSQYGSLQKIPSDILKNKHLRIKYNTKTGALQSISQ